nr:hypothetical protein [Orientia tsutsugamushi]
MAYYVPISYVRAIRSATFVFNCLKWNSFRQEWGSYVKDIEALKNDILNVNLG